MSEPATVNEIQHMLDRTVDRIVGELNNRMAHMETQVDQMHQDMQHMRDEMTRFIQQTENVTRQTSPQDNTFRM